MSADKFINQVQQKMDELRLPPHPHVWVEVERRIREKRKRRVVIVWLLLAGLLLAGGGYVLFNQYGNKNEPITINRQTRVQTIEKINDKTSGNKNKGTTGDKKSETEVVNQTPAIVKDESSSVIKNPKQVRLEVTKEKTVRHRKIPVTNLSSGIKTPDEIATKSTFIPETDKEPVPAVSIILPGITTQPPVSRADNNVFIERSTNKNEVNTIDRIKKDPDSVTKNSLATGQPIKEPKKKKDSIHRYGWEMETNAVIGSARITRGGLLDLNMRKSADFFSAPATGTPAASSGYADSIPSQNRYWEFGISARKQIGKKILFSTGLNLAIYTTRQQVGVFIDSVSTINNDLRSQTFSGFYRAGQSSTFKNRYYFIQLPLLLNWQINKGKKLPLVWENGFIPSFLTGSNALAYDRQSRTFYKDRRLYNKIQLVYHTGIIAKLYKDNKHPLSAGVFYHHHISMLQKISRPDYNYLTSFGATIRWTIKK
jgi:hypothetical protein